MTEDDLATTLALRTQVLKDVNAALVDQIDRAERAETRAAAWKKLAKAHRTTVRSYWRRLLDQTGYCGAKRAWAKTWKAAAARYRLAWTIAASSNEELNDLLGSLWAALGQRARLEPFANTKPGISGRWPSPAERTRRALERIAGLRTAARLWKARAQETWLDRARRKIAEVERHHADVEAGRAERGPDPLESALRMAQPLDLCFRENPGEIIRAARDYLAALDAETHARAVAGSELLGSPEHFAWQVAARARDRAERDLRAALDPDHEETTDGR